MDGVVPYTGSTNLTVNFNSLGPIINDLRAMFNNCYPSPEEPEEPEYSEFPQVRVLQKIAYRYSQAVDKHFNSPVTHFDQVLEKCQDEQYLGLALIDEVRESQTLRLDLKGFIVAQIDGESATIIYGFVSEKNNIEAGFERLIQSLKTELSNNKIVRLNANISSSTNAGMLSREILMKNGFALEEGSFSSPTRNYEKQL